LVIEDINLAAAQFAQLCKADLLDRLIFTPAPCCTALDTAKVIDGAVQMFMARYGVGVISSPVADVGRENGYGHSA
jgi:hypothetical protein